MLMRYSVSDPVDKMSWNFKKCALHPRIMKQIFYPLITTWNELVLTQLLTFQGKERA